MATDFATLFALRDEFLFAEELLRSKVFNDKPDSNALVKADVLAWVAERIQYAIDANLESIREEREWSRKSESV
ncbi:hypothetical protein GJ688_17780 [Heliobacillus mobilis]|uniref:Uncharacterized protein n=1 Tax=Heliobacterium mobile TaxID=28064 RepID=A0A6I3SQ12_HELMO|nr:hypothetical protein [Heliobacterium mobile]MTV50785.1 hypothetical protein [Heliobacterium mobile]